MPSAVAAASSAAALRALRAQECGVVLALFIRGAVFIFMGLVMDAANGLPGRVGRKGSFFAPQLFLHCRLEGNCWVRASLSSPEQMSSWDLLLLLVAGCEIPQPSVQRENRAQGSWLVPWVPRGPV